MIRGLFGVRELPERRLRRRRRQPAPSTPRSLTFGDLVQPGSNMVVLAEDRGREIVVGSVGRFWEKDQGARPFQADEFAAFSEPGYAKLAMGFRGFPLRPGQVTAALRGAHCHHG